MTARVVPTQARLHELLRVDIHGGLHWRQSRRGVRAGPAGMSRNSEDGYLRVRIDGVSYRAHRVVFAMVNGRWPTQEIDHINQVKHDNRPSNLREATHSENAYNTSAKCNNKSGEKGVHWDSREQKWLAKIQFDGRTRYLGQFDDAELAGLAYSSAAERFHGPFANQVLR